MVHQKNKLILHIGGAYTNRKEAIDRFAHVYNHDLSDRIKRHLIIENDDRIFNIDEVLDISARTGCPVVFDVLHHQVLHQDPYISISECINRASKTWKESDGVQKIHYSQQDPQKHPGAHTYSIGIREFFDFYQDIAVKDVDIMLEVKDKNRSALKIHTTLCHSHKELEGEWARYKYLVMCHSQKHYEILRLLFRSQDDNQFLMFYQLVEEALNIEPTVKTKRNVANHIWGYFKKVATQKEKEHYLNMINDLDTHWKSCVKFLNRLTNKYDIIYLKNSYFFTDVLN